MIDHLIKDCDVQGFNSDLQLVKGASVFIKDKIVYIKHYDTIIFAHDIEKGITEADFDCSMTSNKQINYALNHFNIIRASVINTHEGSKYNYHGDYV